MFHHVHKLSSANLAQSTASKRDFRRFASNDSLRAVRFCCSVNRKMDWRGSSLFRCRLRFMSAPNSFDNNSSNNKYQPVFSNYESFKVHDHFQEEKYCVDAVRHLGFRYHVYVSALRGLGQFHLPPGQRHVFYILPV